MAKEDFFTFVRLGLSGVPRANLAFEIEEEEPEEKRWWKRVPEIWRTKTDD